MTVSCRELAWRMGDEGNASQQSRAYSLKHRPNQFKRLDRHACYRALLLMSSAWISPRLREVRREYRRVADGDAHRRRWRPARSRPAGRGRDARRRSTQEEARRARRRHARSRRRSIADDATCTSRREAITAETSLSMVMALVLLAADHRAMLIDANATIDSDVHHAACASPLHRWPSPSRITMPSSSGLGDNWAQFNFRHR